MCALKTGRTLFFYPIYFYIIPAVTIAAYWLALKLENGNLSTSSSSILSISPFTNADNLAFEVSILPRRPFNLISRTSPPKALLFVYHKSSACFLNT